MYMTETVIATANVIVIVIATAHVVVIANETNTTIKNALITRDSDRTTYYQNQNLKLNMMLIEIWNQLRVTGVGTNLFSNDRPNMLVRLKLVRLQFLRHHLKICHIDKVLQTSQLKAIMFKVSEAEVRWI